MKKPFALFLFLVPAMARLHAQDTLPAFSVKNLGNNRIVVSWTNTFKNIKQISIQRSFDSLANYKTILTVPDPMNPQNGYADTKAANGQQFYRLYILLDKGAFIFSQAKRPVLDSMRKVDYSNKIEKIGGVDTVGMPDLGIGNKDKPEVFVPSLHVFTYKDGYVRVNLPDDADKKYSIKFFDETDLFLFELKNLKERTFKIDRTDFYHAGWFKFELYEDGKLIEKYKFYLEKDF